MHKDIIGHVHEPTQEGRGPRGKMRDPSGWEQSRISQDPKIPRLRVEVISFAFETLV